MRPLLIILMALSVICSIGFLLILLFAPDPTVGVPLALASIASSWYGYATISEERKSAATYERLYRDRIDAYTEEVMERHL